MRHPIDSASMWHVLDASSIWIREFTSALANRVPTLGWVPEMKATALFQTWEQKYQTEDPPFTAVKFPLQRGYARAPLRWISRFERRAASSLIRYSYDPKDSPLVCTTPFYAPVAEIWPGPVVYYSTDLTVAYEGVSPKQIRSLDRRLCAVAAAVFPNSSRIANYFVQECGCAPDKITVVPNATRSSNLQEHPSTGADEFPPDIRHVKRPLAGVIGNLAANMDWLFLREAIALTPSFQWVFVGPATMRIEDRRQREARESVIALNSRVHFIGPRDYGQLQRYARAFDVAVLPYKRKEPTYSGSSTRFYEHLAAGRPMVSTRGFGELLDKEPLLKLVDDAGELASCLYQLKALQFRDGCERLRWEASRQATWDARAQTIRSALGGSSYEPCGNEFSSVSGISSRG